MDRDACCNIRMLKLVNADAVLPENKNLAKEDLIYLEAESLFSTSRYLITMLVHGNAGCNLGMLSLINIDNVA